MISFLVCKEIFYGYVPDDYRLKCMYLNLPKNMKQTQKCGAKS